MTSAGDEDAVSEAEAAAVDLDGLLGAGITAPDGGLRGELQGIGSVAAAVQLGGAGVTAAQLADVAGAVEAGVPLERLAAVGEPDVAPALAGVLRSADAVIAREDDRLAFARWLRLVAELVAVRAGSRP